MVIITVNVTWIRVVGLMVIITVNVTWIRVVGLMVMWLLYYGRDLNCFFSLVQLPCVVWIGVVLLIQSTIIITYYDFLFVFSCLFLFVCLFLVGGGGCYCFEGRRDHKRGGRGQGGTLVWLPFTGSCALGLKVLLASKFTFTDPNSCLFFFFFFSKRGSLERRKRG